MPATLIVSSRLSAADRWALFTDDVRTGLTATPKFLSRTWFYDERGSRLFDEITRLPEYYLTRAERALLERHAGEIIRIASPASLVELGAGTSEKTRILLDCVEATGGLEQIILFDISEEILRESAAALDREYPNAEVLAIVGDFHDGLGQLPPGRRRLVAFLGSTIGNLVPEQRAVFLRRVRDGMAGGDLLLLGTDLIKDSRRLIAAYDDPGSVTAEFNRNVLHVLNRELGADFDVEAFTHVATWNDQEHWMEMRLRAQGAQRVRLPRIDLMVNFDDGEDLLSEISAKFSPEMVAGELAAAGFIVDRTFTDGDFLLTLARTV